MYYIGWVGCPHCLFRERICIEAESPLPPGRFVEFCCPNDSSRHRFSLARMQPVTECPPDLKPWTPPPPEPIELPYSAPAGVGWGPRGWLELVLIWLCIAIGALTVAALLLYCNGVPRRWIEF